MLTGIDLAKLLRSKKYTLHLSDCQFERSNIRISHCHKALWISDKAISQTVKY